MRDPILSLVALVGLFVLIGGTIALAMWRRRHQKPAPAVEKPSAIVAASTAAANDRRRKEELKRLDDEMQMKRALAIQEGRVLADGRPRCQASAACSEVALYTQPSIERDEGVSDFIRRAFGAPRRYRLVEGVRTDTPGLLRRMGEALGIEYQHPVTRAGAKYCPTHIHVLHSVCRDKLAADEREQAQAELAREVSLAQFEHAGMEVTCRKLMQEIEDREAGKKRRKKADLAQVVPLDSSRPQAARGG